MDILIIGDNKIGLEGTHVQWSQVPDQMPSAFLFSAVVVVPQPDTFERQKSLIEVLNGDLSASAAVRTHVIWIINSFRMQVSSPS